VSRGGEAATVGAATASLSLSQFLVQKMDWMDSTGSKLAEKTATRGKMSLESDTNN